jgi:hypothetical protein
MIRVLRIDVEERRRVDGGGRRSGQGRDLKENES